MLAALALAVVAVAVWFMLTRADRRPAFDGAQALALAERQVAFGPRVPGTAAHAEARAWMLGELRRYAPRVVEQPFTAWLPPDSTALTGYNLIASFRPEMQPRILLCAHYDSRPTADRDPDPARRAEPVPGADDGASGVAVLLELARVFSEHPPPVGVDLVFFDAEDLGTDGAAPDDSAAVPFAIGSEAFAQQNPQYRPAWGVLLDMVGGPDLEIPREGYSQQYAPDVVARVWAAADRAGVDVLVDQTGGPVMDDHVAFLRRGVPVIDLIPQPFPSYWHTTADTPEQLSAESLDAIGRVLIEALYGG